MLEQCKDCSFFYELSGTTKGVCTNFASPIYDLKIDKSTEACDEFLFKNKLEITIFNN